MGKILYLAPLFQALLMLERDCLTSVRMILLVVVASVAAYIDLELVKTKFKSHNLDSLSRRKEEFSNLFTT